MPTLHLNDRSQNRELDHLIQQHSNFVCTSLNLAISNRSYLRSVLAALSSCSCRQECVNNFFRMHKQISLSSDLQKCGAWNKNALINQIHVWRKHLCIFTSVTSLQLHKRSVMQARALDMKKNALTRTHNFMKTPCTLSDFHAHTITERESDTESKG